MGMRFIIQCLIFFLLGILSCSRSLAIQGPPSSGTLQMKEPKDAVQLEKTTIHGTQKNQDKDSDKSSHRMMIAETFMGSSSSMPEMDVVNPVATIPVLNPTTPTTNVPTYNPYVTPTNPTSPTMTPVTNPYSAPAMGTPVTNPYSAPSMGTPAMGTPAMGTPAMGTPAMGTPTSSGQSWCIASPTASETALQVALDYACGYGGADCSQIQQGGSCFNPDNVRDHASYAFNSYYQKNPVSTSCDFGGTAMITNTDPSTTTCQYLSTSTGSSVLNTTNPTGSTVFGSVPPSTSGSITMPMGMLIVLPVTCLLMSQFSFNV